MPQEKRQRRLSGDQGLQDLNNPIRSKIEDIFKREIKRLRTKIDILELRETNSPLHKELENKTKEILHLIKRDSFLKLIIVREMKRVKILENEIKILKDIGTFNKDIEKELESLMNSDNDHGAQITSSDQPEDDADTFSDEEDSDDRISEADDENSQDGITENENQTDTDLSMSENVPGIDSSNMRIKDEPMEEEFKKTNPKHIKRIGHICRLCGFKAATKNPVRQLEDHLAQKHF